MDSWGNICSVDNTGEKVAPCDATPGCKDGNQGLDMSTRDFQYVTGGGATSIWDSFDLDYAEKQAEARKLPILCVGDCPLESEDCSAAAARAGPADPMGACYPYCINAPYSLSEVYAGDLGATGDGCPDGIYATYESEFLRRCLSTDGVLGASAALFDSQGNETQALDFLADFFNVNYLSDTFLISMADSFAASADVIIYCMLIAAAFSLLIIFLMRLFVKPMVWALLIVFVGLMVLLTVYCYNEYDTLNTVLEETPEAQQSDDDQRNRLYFEIAAWSCAVLTVLFVLVLVAMRKPIKKAIAIYEVTATALRQMPSMFLSPLFTYGFLLACTAIWVIVMMYVMTLCEYVQMTGDWNVGEGHVICKEEKNYSSIFWWWCFIGLWVSQFILAAGEMTLAGCVTQWYRKQGSTGSGALFRSMWRVTRYHLGTVAFGSLIVAVVQFVRVILQYIKDKTTKENPGAFAQFLIKACMCCLWCLEKCIKYLNRNAYVEVQLYGLDFCNACCAAFKIILSNVLTVAAVNMVGWLVLFVVKLSVALATSMIAYYWLEGDKTCTASAAGEVCTYNVPMYGYVVLVIGVAAYLIAYAFAEVYDMAADAMVICFCEDAATQGEPLAPKRLRKFFKSYHGGKAPAEGGEAPTTKTTQF